MAAVAFLQQRIEQHRTERRRQRHGQPKRDAIAHQPVHHIEQRKIGLGDRLVEPVFLEKLFVLRMTHERQVRMQDQRDLALERCHVTFSLSGLGRTRRRKFRRLGNRPAAAGRAEPELAEQAGAEFFG